MEPPPIIDRTDQPSINVSRQDHKPRRGLAIIIGLLSFLVLSSLAVAAFFYYQNQQLIKLNTVTPEPYPPNLRPTPTTDSTTEWEIYTTNTDENISFKYPSPWQRLPILIRGSGFLQEFEDPEGSFEFAFSATGNSNQLTGKPFSSLMEYAQMSYPGRIVNLDGQEGRQYLPRAGSENVNSVDFFSPDQTVIYNLFLKTGDTPLNTAAVEIQAGQALFSKILATFKFIDQFASEPDNLNSTQQYVSPECGVNPGCGAGADCTEKGQEANVSGICVVLPEAICYLTARCEIQPNGNCGWSQTSELTACLARFK
ncbi:hypothetical protein A2W24_04295 [Microgenomates group bacterium RBG_16_45_19]|nr:MAG: hypothetical protein A2W24_04295 [Microgenomates group bacterium RBG_16_45_19]